MSDDVLVARDVAQYDETAQRAASLVIRRYSTSFGLGSRLLGRTTRRRIEAVYALVRVADEIVDTYGGDGAGRVLEAMRSETHAATSRGWSADLVVHAFARTAQATGIGADLVDPFFDSMAADLSVDVHTQESYERYVYGSAEVVGLMCLRVFLQDAEPPLGPDAPSPPDLVVGARALGAAFQKINFLRDLRADHVERGRSYFPGVRPDDLDDACMVRLLAEIRADVDQARTALPGLPRRPRAAVAATIALYDRLLRRLADTPPAQVLERRVRVPDGEKIVVAGAAALRALREG
ncbi:Phytoene/squalene synthetase [Paraoerskovia marina]|uniref:Phytoene/squalene synthetase n=1 Tax=Paraoerskovia marina TaxID=545619 RepID=A0A1H1W3H9_9CELL|nr:squalene/phytoene synthase family protein [Paraoerskovia marina]SDS91605.1 Phytoene/squalene synthetase [Paraoerskovia marina]